MDSLQWLIMVLALSADPASSTRPADAQHPLRDARSAAVVASIASADVAFGLRERRLIQDYYRSNPRPSAQANAIERKRQLPPALEARPLPASLARLLPLLPRGYQRVVAGQDVVLVEVATGTVIDVVRI